MSESEIKEYIKNNLRLEIDKEIKYVGGNMDNGSMYKDTYKLSLFAEDECISMVYLD